MTTINHYIRKSNLYVIAMFTLLTYLLAIPSFMNNISLSKTANLSESGVNNSELIITDFLDVTLLNPNDPEWTLEITESIFIDPSNPSDIARDLDHDMLKDDIEGFVADYYRPYYKFDSIEAARRVTADINEPVTIFQVRPYGCIDCGTTAIIKIRWVFLFERDGGYGSCSLCFDSHPGGNDRAYYTLEVSNNGRTFNMLNIGLADWHVPTLIWPNEPLYVYNRHHPAIFMSAHKHHMYFDNSYHCGNSFYSDYWCNDNVMGNGDSFISDLHSHFKDDRYNNVGEPPITPIMNHITGYFVNDLWEFPGESAWGTDPFYAVDSNGEIRFGPLYGLCGDLNGTLNSYDSPYTVTCDLNIPTNTSLNADPGTILRFNTSASLTSNGTLYITNNNSGTISLLSINNPNRGIIIHPGGQLKMSNGGSIRFE